jgi:hypothetical protein
LCDKEGRCGIRTDAALDANVLAQKFVQAVDDRFILRIAESAHEPIMSFDAQGIFANLAEKERLKGHHSPEGRTIRMLSRALHGWSSASLSAGDVVVLCDQAIEDWLKSSMKISEWSTKNLDALLLMAVERQLLTAPEAEQLRQVHEMRSRSAVATVADAESALECSIQIVEERW